VNQGLSRSLVCQAECVGKGRLEAFSDSVIAIPALDFMPERGLETAP
jgi:hypothetical protein